MSGTIKSCLAAYPRNPKGFYAALIELGGDSHVFWDEQLEGWIVTGHPECSSFLRSPALGRQRLRLPRISGAEGLIDFADSILLAQTMFDDSPDAAELRREMPQPLTDMDVHGSPCHVSQLTDTLAAAPRGDHVFDAYSEMLQPFVSRMICERLGISETDRLSIYPLIMRCVRFLDGKLADMMGMLESVHALTVLYTIAASRIETSHVMEDQRHRLISNFLQWLVAGHESPAFALATIFLHWPINEQSNGRLTASRGWAMKMALESMRFDAPVQMVGRVAIDRLKVRDATIRPGDRVFIHLGAANRDPDIFDRPDEFLIDRSTSPVITFGLGESSCPGRSFAVRTIADFLQIAAAAGSWIQPISETLEPDHGVAGRGLKCMPATLRRWPITVEHMGLRNE